MSLYINQEDDFQTILTALQPILDDIIEAHPDDIIIIGGDFNAHVGDLDTAPSEAFQLGILNDTRSSRDNGTDTRGRLIIEFMDTNGFILLNGRTTSDSPANFTCKRIDKFSTIDLVWINESKLEMVEDMSVVEDRYGSDHFPVNLRLFTHTSAVASVGSSNRGTHTIKWKNSYENNFIHEMSLAPEIFVNFELSDTNLLAERLNSAISSAAQNSRMTAVKRDAARVHKPWFDKECLTLRRKTRQALQSMRKTRDQVQLKLTYLELDKQYTALITSKKAQYFNDVREKFANLRNPKEFWMTVKKITPKVFQHDSISLEDWSTFLKQVYPTQHCDGLTFFGVTHPQLDMEITSQELTVCLKHIKKGKAPGYDQISNEFYQSLPEEWLAFLVGLFNKVLTTESFPAQWARIIVFMLHKKGPRSDPFNYRGIALINTCAKIFTQILHNRIYPWAIAAGLIPGEQTGFVRGRGTADNIFVLQAAIHTRLRQKGGRVFALFVDFKRAFDSVPHYKLWLYLYSIGLSAKIIRCLMSFYNQTTLQIRSKNLLSDEVRVGEGVLQGEILSPLLFILYLGDIVDFFKSKGFEGISLNSIRDLLLLLYADDLVILGRSPNDLKRKIATMMEYCAKKGLSVNVKKTKIVVFRKGGNIPNSVKNLKFNDEPIEVVESYTYLGVEFSSSGLGALASKESNRKARMAMGRIFSVLASARADSWASTLRLYNSLAASVLLYSTHLFGLRYCHILEASQLSFFKRLFHLPKRTPNYSTRLELGLAPVDVLLVETGISWIIKVLKMEPIRLPRICYDRLLALRDAGHCQITYNWISQLDALARGFITEDLWQSKDWTIWESKKYIILNQLTALLRDKDLERAINSKAHQITIPRSSTDNYLSFYPERCPIHLVRTKMQIRLATIYSGRFLINKKLFRIEPREICARCRLGELESFPHLLLRCTAYDSIRAHHISPWIAPNTTQSENLTRLLNSTNLNCLKDLYLFMIKLFESRSLLS